MDAAKEEQEKKGLEDGEVTTLSPRSDPTSIVAIAKNLGLRSLAWLGVYLLGYYNFSLGWMVTPLLLSVLRDQWKKVKRNKLAAAREAALTNEQAMLEARMGAEELPSWVFFPDKDRAEWVNNILKQLWPYVNMYVRDMLFKTIEPLVDETLKGYSLNPFKFNRDRVFLGQVPPRITGIKVYDQNTSRKEIIMDMDIVFASDLVIEFKVKGIAARVSDFGLRGMLRVVFKPLVSQIPLIGGVQVYFLKAPEIDYDLGGVGGVLEIPGLNKIVENIIIEQVKNFIVLPNKFSMPLIPEVLNKTLKCPDSAGVLRVKLIKARNLVDKDGLGSGVSDPYAMLTVGATSHRAATIRDNLNPEWNDHFDFPIEVVQGQELNIEFYDDDDRKDDEFLGRAKIQTSLVAQRGHIEGYWVDLVESDKDSDKEQGSVQVSLTWLPVTMDPEVVRESARQASPEDIDAKCLIHIFVDSCSGLGDPGDPSYNTSPMVELFNGRDNQRSWPQYYNNDPVIEQGFVMLSRSPYTDEIRINVVDKNAKSKKKQVVGTTSIRVWSLIEQPGMEYPMQPFILKGHAPNAQICLSASLRGLVRPESGSPRRSVIHRDPKNPGARLASPKGLTSLAYDGEVKNGRIKVTIHRAEDLKAKDINGKADPYAVLTYEDQKFETKVCKKTLEPEWDHEMFIDVHEGGDNQVKIELFDKDKIGKDETMGWTTVDVRRISKQGSILEELDNLLGAKRGRVMWSMTFLPEEEDPMNAPEVPSPAPAPYTPTPSPYKEEAPVKRGFGSDSTIMDEAEGEAETLIRVKRDPIDIDEPTEEVSAPTPAKDQSMIQNETASAPAPVDNLGYMGPVLPGFLRVTVHRAEDLMDKDIAGKSDPYVVIKYAGQKNKSKKVKSCLNPEFEFTTGYVTEEGGPTELVIELWDHDVGKDESLGHIFYDIRALHSGERVHEEWATLQAAKKGRVQLSLEFSHSGYNDGPTPEEEIQPWTPPQPETSTELVPEIPPPDELRKRTVAGLGKIRLNLLYDDNREELKVFVHEAAGLPGGDLPDPPDPQVKVYLMPGKKKKKKSEVVKDSVEPRFNEEFDFSIDFDKLPQHSIKISVVDKKGVFSKSPTLGTCTISLDNPGLKAGLANWLPLEAADEDSD